MEISTISTQPAATIPKIAPIDIFSFVLFPSMMGLKSEDEEVVRNSHKKQQNR